jgi:hypothetical protein
LGSENNLLASPAYPNDAAIPDINPTKKFIRAPLRTYNWNQKKQHYSAWHKWSKYVTLFVVSAKIGFQKVCLTYSNHDNKNKFWNME